MLVASHINRLFESIYGGYRWRIIFIVVVSVCGIMTLSVAIVLPTYQQQQLLHTQITQRQKLMSLQARKLNHLKQQISQYWPALSFTPGQWVSIAERSHLKVQSLLPAAPQKNGQLTQLGYTATVVGKYQNWLEFMMRLNKRALVNWQEIDIKPQADKQIKVYTRFQIIVSNNTLPKVHNPVPITQIKVPSVIDPFFPVAVMSSIEADELHRLELSQFILTGLIRWGHIWLAMVTSTSGRVYVLHSTEHIAQENCSVVSVTEHGINLRCGKVNRFWALGQDPGVGHA